MNKVIIMGRLCADPEYKETPSGTAFTKIRVAVNRPKNKETGEQEADFINVTCWKSTAEFVCRYFSKGKMIIVEGSLRNNDYTDKNNVKHYSYDVVAHNVEFGESKSASEGAAQPQGYAEQARPAAVPQYGTVPPPQNNPYAPQKAAERPAAQTVANAPKPLSIGDLGEFEDILSDGELPF